MAEFKHNKSLLVRLSQLWKQWSLQDPWSLRSNEDWTAWAEVSNSFKASVLPWKIDQVTWAVKMYFGSVLSVLTCLLLELVLASEQFQKICSCGLQFLMLFKRLVGNLIPQMQWGELEWISQSKTEISTAKNVAGTELTHSIVILLHCYCFLLSRYSNALCVMLNHAF